MNSAQARSINAENNLETTLLNERSRAGFAEASLATAFDTRMQQLSGSVASMVASNNAALNASLLLVGATVGAQIFAAQLSTASEMASLSSAFGNALSAEQSHVSAIQQFLSSADAAVQANINSQIAALASSLTSSLSLEQTRASETEASLAASLTMERSRALAAEAAASTAVAQGQSTLRTAEASMAVVLAQTQRMLVSMLAEMQANFTNMEAQLSAQQFALSQQSSATEALATSMSTTTSSLSLSVTELQNGSGIAPGMVAYFANTCPSAWLKCNGAAVSRSTYAALFAVISTTYGGGDGATTFNVPELRGEFLRVLDDGRGVDAGRTLNSWQVATAVYNLYGDATMPDNDAAVLNGDGSYVGTTQGLQVSYFYNVISRTWAYVRPRNVAMYACIKT